MKGKYPLTDISINGTVPTAPGAYILVNSSNNAVYVGRSDTDLNGRLKNHLSGNEENSWIQRSSPTDYYFEVVVDSQEAYKLECEWFHKYRPNCNTAHPAKMFNGWICPICGL